jgi:flagella basal body P-ring formation protein FlgA
MKAVAAVMISSLMILVWSIQASAGLSVRIMESVTVSAAEFSLADIAEVQAEDPGLKEMVETIKLGVAPRPGYTERVSRKDVVQRIEKLHPEMRGLISWTGSEKISIRSAETWLSLQPFISQARDLLLSDLRQDQDDKTKIEIEPVQPPQGVNVPRGIVDVTTRITNNAKLNKRMCAWLDVAVNGRHHQTIPVWFALKAYKPVLAAKRPLSVHQSLRSDDFVTQVQDVAGISNFLADFSLLPASMWLKHPVREGATITADDLEEIPLVRSGQSVHVMLATGPVQIETEGVAQIHGRLGDIVRVQNLQTKGIYPARVTGMGMVTVNAR